MCIRDSYLRPTVGVLLNISPDHLDRHGPAHRPADALRNYAKIKERLVVHAADSAVVGVEDEHCRAILEELDSRARRVYPFTTDKIHGVLPRFYAIGTILHHWRSDTYSTNFGSDENVASLDGVGTLRGRHNVQNALAALAAITALLEARDPATAGAEIARIAKGITTYPGLPHRMEEVGRAGRVLFINDSKATNADSTEKALASWPSDIFWILGGKAKEGGITTLTQYFPRIAKAYLIGEASEAFATTLAGHVAFERCGTLDVATRRAAEDAAKSGGAEPVVLLSPACASYDQFKGFDQRGDAFRDLVRGLPGIAANGGGAP